LCSPITCNTENAELLSPFSHLEKHSPQVPKAYRGGEAGTSVGKYFSVGEGRRGCAEWPTPPCMTARRQLTLGRAWYIYSLWKCLGLVCPAQEILNFCRRKTGEKGTGKTRHENYTQEQVFFSGKDIGTVLHAMNACLEDQTGGLT